MPTSTDLLIRLWNSHHDYLGRKSLSRHDCSSIEQLATIFCPGPSFHYVLDSPTLTFDSVSDSCQQVLGCAAQDLSLRTLVDHIHPDDLEYFLRCEDLVAHFLKNCIPPDKMVCYKINYCIRLQVPGSNYHLFLLQTLTLETTSNGELLKVFGTLSDIEHLGGHNNYRLSFIGLAGEPSLTEVDVLQDQPLKDFTPYPLFTPSRDFTRREMEVIRLLGRGLSTAEIGAQLHIATPTVVTHRKNVLRKSNARNTAELVANCIRKGYI